MDAMHKPNYRNNYSDIFLMEDIDGRSDNEITLELSEREYIEKIEKELQSEN